MGDESQPEVLMTEEVKERFEARHGYCYEVQALGRGPCEGLQRALAQNERLRALVAWALPYCPELLPSMEGGEYARRYHEAEAAVVQEAGDRPVAENECEEALRTVEAAFERYREQMSEALVHLTWVHHSMLVPSRMHAPQYQSWAACPCLTCKRTQDLCPDDAVRAREEWGRDE